MAVVQKTGSGDDDDDERGRSGPVLEEELMGFANAGGEGKRRVQDDSPLSKC